MRQGGNSIFRLYRVGSLLWIGLVAAWYLGTAPWATAATGQDEPSIVRLAVVNATEFSGLFDALGQDFQAQTGYQLEVFSGSAGDVGDTVGDDDIFVEGPDGVADVLISHYGRRPVQQFVLDGLGLWPVTVFGNTQALIGPPSDPANIRGTRDVVEAFRRIAETESPYVSNAIRQSKYIENIIWEAAGRPPKTAWYIDAGARASEAIDAAAAIGAYTLWGAFPFLHRQQEFQLDLELMVTEDPLLLRLMVAIAVNPEKFPVRNFAGGQALIRYLLTPAAQARIRAFRIPGVDFQLWWPMGRSNSADVFSR
jgi:tungstate transport system substrate-binding protein